VQSRGRVSRRPSDSRPAATHSPRDRIATGDHTPGVPAKRHTELRTGVAHKALAAGRTRAAARSLFAVHRPVHRRTAGARTCAVFVDREKRCLDARNSGMVPWREIMKRLSWLKNGAGVVLRRAQFGRSPQLRMHQVKPPARLRPRKTTRDSTGEYPRWQTSEVGAVRLVGFVSRPRSTCTPLPVRDSLPRFPTG
jgi:hypothetical protein